MEEAGFEAWVFHASGVGGCTMEKLISMGRIHAVMDMTLAEVGAHLVGGLHDAGPNRLEAAARIGLPQVIVPGAADRTKKMAEAARAVNRDMLILCHGGPISSPSDVQEVLKRAPIHGFVGASSMERLPVEKGIREMTAAFAALKLPKR